MFEVFSAACTTRQLGDGGGSIPPRSAEQGRKKVGQHCDGKAVKRLGILEELRLQRSTETV